MIDLTVEKQSSHAKTKLTLSVFCPIIKSILQSTRGLGGRNAGPDTR